MPMIRLFRILPRGHRIAISTLSASLLLLGLAPAESALASRDSADTAVIGKRQPLPLKVENIPFTDTQRRSQERVVQVRPGDALSLIFARQELPSSLLHEISRLKAASPLQTLHPGDQLTFRFSPQGDFTALLYPLDAARTLEIRKGETGLESRINSAELENRTRFAQAQVTSNFWNAGRAAGLNANQIMNLAGMFAWDLDFALDIRAGDHFTVLFEETYKDGFRVGTGDILAAEFVNQGRVYQAIRHDDGNYYSPDGRAMRKSFLRAPVNFSHISSNFNPRRLHPVTGKVRPHRGIDYAARTGTPVMAAGSGVVTESGYNRFNGNYVFIRHDSKYLTKYLHLHKRMVKKGQRVKQEQQIGTLGATGRVTGPHLHYEFLVNGVHKDPKTVKLPQAAKLPATELARFKPRAKQLLAQLTQISGVMLAKN
ncbi:peptidoglycan DD-metalloendopeptidase family protein [Oceanimonas sp. CHS3-5]|uniref:peptidoglycan DD-metalloendopeptidase family protein n=1 Tax=Oceanimonas sp. CHS3-5 TaxID=3068186 RepID=UPI00273CFB24|nr:peptidoglycan DD-metalloendopeptidase family protein [Oceanimonas sp. CHS3-5]MDP5293710.1 peptidoglycan DD-metalloendopeptidase family protein [Oceanimonas sp. CHS3-5]